MNKYNSIFLFVAGFLLASLGMSQRLMLSQLNHQKLLCAM